MLCCRMKHVLFEEFIESRGQAKGREIGRNEIMKKSAVEGFVSHIKNFWPFLES